MEHFPDSLLHAADGWSTPPLDGSLSVPELYDFHYANNPDRPVFVYPDPVTKSLHHVHYSSLVPAVHRSGWLVAELAGFNLDLPADPPRLVATLDMSDTITAFTVYLGILRANIQLMPMSPRNSATNVAYLLREMRPSHLLVSDDAMMLKLARTSLHIMEEHERPIIISMPTYETMYHTVAEFRPLPPRQRDILATRIILHSSGSTAFPKIIRYSDKMCTQLAMAPFTASLNFNGKTFAAHTLMNLFHVSGFFFMSWQPTTGLVIGVFPPSSPAVTPSFDAVWKGTLAVKPDFLFVIPVLLENWSEDPKKVANLRDIQGIVFGGGPLNKAVGDSLVHQGCNIYSTLGSTEAGTYCLHLQAPLGMDWEYIQLNPLMASVMDPQGDATFELIAIARPDGVLPAANVKWNGQDAYATNDLFVPHPTLANRWKLISRKDDQIMLSTGEKTNPVPLEAVLNQSSYVDSCIMFGRGRVQNGVLVQLKTDYLFEPHDKDAVEKYRALIWPSIQTMNEVAPSHSRLFKEMVIFSHPAKPFAITPKGTIRRAFTLHSYDAEIENLYATIETYGGVTAPEEWNYDSSRTFVRAVVNKTLARPVNDEENLFAHGCDSLQAAWIRNVIFNAVSHSPPKVTVPVTTNFVYTNPTISMMSCRLAGMSVGIEHAETASADRKLKDILDVFESCALPGCFSPTTVGETARPSPGAVVLITGTTGSVGAATLAKLVQCDDVLKVYAINRLSQNGSSLFDRQKEALSSRGYAPQSCEVDKVILLEGDITKLGPSLMDEIKQSVTHIIHSAWPVDFNLTLISFMNVLVGMRELIKLAVHSLRNPRFLFISSISVLRNCESDSAFEASVTDCMTAAGQGYSESKWIAENMLYRAAKEASLQVTILRTGQIAGGLNGAWNSSDWIPAIMKSSVALGCVPILPGSCSWIPLDVAAGAILDVVVSEEVAQVQVLHLVHPHPQPSEDICRMLAERVDLPLISFLEWFGRLEARTRDPSTPFQDLPALKLLEFFRESLARKGTGVRTIDCTHAQRLSATLRDAKPLNVDDVQRWLQYWMEIGFLSLRSLNGAEN